MARFNRPNNLEARLMKLLDQLYPSQWKYTGDGSLVLGGKKPDFANVNGQKKLIELDGTWWHRSRSSELKRPIYASFGFDLLVITSDDMKDESKVIGMIQRFYVA